MRIRTGHSGCTDAVGDRRGVTVLRQDLGVVGFGDIALDEDLTPALSTITQPNHDIGRMSVELLIGALADERRRDARRSVAAAVRLSCRRLVRRRPALIPSLAPDR